jgi:ATP/ADP translocase
MIALLRNWSFTSFYVITELWAIIVMTVLFWGFANEVTTVDEAKRFYAIFAIGANFSGIFSGQSAQFCDCFGHSTLARCASNRLISKATARPCALLARCAST